MALYKTTYETTPMYLPLQKSIAHIKRELCLQLNNQLKCPLLDVDDFCHQKPLDAGPSLSFKTVVIVVTWFLSVCCGRS
jgi:hypothetical protein